MAKLDPFDIGQIKAHAKHGLSAPQIAELVFKTNGENPSKQAIHDVLAKLVPIRTDPYRSVTDPCTDPS